MSNPISPNDLKDSHPDIEPQDPDPWTTIPIAVRASFKEKFHRTSHRLGLKPSQYGRMVLHDAVTRAEAA